MFSKQNNVLYSTQTIPPSPRGPSSVGNEHALLKTYGNEHYTQANWSMFTAKYAGAGANTLFCNPMLQGLSDLVGGEGIAIEKVTSAVPQFDSPVIEAGTSVLWRHDYNGVPIPRDRPDIGPFQHRRPLKSDERVLDLRPRCSCPGRSKDLCKPLASGPPPHADVHV